MREAEECQEKMLLNNNEYQNKVFSSDAEFDSLFPIHIQDLSALHWTPLYIAAIAAPFLAQDHNAKVIDIGAGIGKFCMGGSHYTNGSFTGIEQRQNFVRAGKKVIDKLRLDRVALLHGNFTEIDISDFSGIYFFNSFHENLVFSDALDKKVELSTELFEQYTSSLLAKLDAMPAGTRLATYWLLATEVPGSYQLLESHFDDLLKLWVKV